MPAQPGPPATPSFLSKSDYAYDVVKRRILSEELAPGDVVGQERLAAEIGVSTTPLREALKRLATEGLVRLGAHRDARVAELVTEEARSLYEVRLTVDPLAAGLAAERRSTAEVAALEDALERLHPLSGSPGWEALVAHREFHRAVYRASHNAPLVDILEGLWDKADRYRLASLREQPRSAADVARVQAEHRDLAAAVAAGDAARAEQVMRDHVAGSLGRRVIDQLAEPGA